MQKSLLLRLTALLLCLLLTGCAATSTGDSMLLSAPDLPDMAQYPADDIPYNGDEYRAWRESIAAQQRDSAYTEGLAPFLQNSSRVFLSGAEEENRVYSPLSLYMALAMLAESTGGNARAEILALLGKEDIAALRQQASDLWNANYRNDGTMTRTLAASLWLNETVPFNQQTVETLSGSYYASVYRGKMGSAEFNAALQKWLDDNTLGLLTEQAQSIRMPASTLAGIATTVAFNARWDSVFSQSQNEQRIFHAPKEDVTCEFLHSSGANTLYWGERFQAVCEPFDQDGRMWLILPDEGVTPADLLADAEALSFLTDAADWAQRETMIVNLSVPKFDVSSQLELSAGLQALGVTDVFGTGADFSPLTNADLPISLSQVRHDARVTIDEEGCEAAAYTVMLMLASAPPQEAIKLNEIDFILDRPFLFVITGADNLPLFVGVVNQP